MIFEIKVRFWQIWKKYVLNTFKSAREDYPIGFMSHHPTETNLTWQPTQDNIDKVEAVLISIGYQPNYFSFADEGQITSMRQMYIDPNGFWRQTHIRVHTDGEIRGHDELCYEESAIDHVNGVGAVPITEEKQTIIMNALRNL